MASANGIPNASPVETETNATIAAGNSPAKTARAAGGRKPKRGKAVSSSEGDGSPTPRPARAVGGRKYDDVGAVSASARADASTPGPAWTSSPAIQGAQGPIDPREAAGPMQAADIAASDGGEPYRSKETMVRNRLGLHSRAAARLAQAIEPYDCEIYVEKADLRADARSILDLISLCCPCDTKLTLYARGPEAERALEVAGDLILGRFGEDE